MEKLHVRIFVILETAVLMILALSLIQGMSQEQLVDQVLVVGPW